MGRTLLTAVFAASLCLSARAALACESDTDCKGDRVCQKGECIEPAAAKAATAGPETPPPPQAPGTTDQPPETRPPSKDAAVSTDVPKGRDDGKAGGDDKDKSDAPQLGPTPKAHGGVYLGALGFLQFGPTLALEFGGGGKGVSVAGFVRARAMNLGPLPYIIAATSDDKFKFGYGAGAGLRLYFSQAGNLRGFYMGGAAEYISWDSEEDDGKHEGAEVKYLTRFVMPQIELGYRWIFGKNFSFAVGGAAGYLVLITNDTKYDVSNSKTTEEHLRSTGYVNGGESQPYASLNLEVGFVF